MPTITPSYTYTDNTTLDVDGHNQNVYTTSNNEGLMSTANGELDSGNLAPTFLVQAEHVHPEQSVVMRQESMRESIDCFQQAFARSPAGTYANIKVAPASLWVPIPGCAIRFYQPYAASFGLLSWSFFTSAYIPSVGTVSGGSFTPSTATIAGVALMLDGTILEHTKRNLSRVDGLDTGVSANQTLDGNGESRASKWFDQSHLIESVSKGYHSCQLVLFMDIMSARARDIHLSRNNETIEDITCQIFQRVSFGIRNVKVVTFL
jgi:hypothetical protein